MIGASRLFQNFLLTNVIYYTGNHLIVYKNNFYQIELTVCKQIIDTT